MHFNIRKTLLTAGLTAAFSAMTVCSAFAANAKIAFSDPVATVGDTFTVNVKITTDDGNLGASDVMLSYDPSAIEFVSGNNANGGAGSVRLVGTMDSATTKQFSYQLTFKAKGTGNTAINVASYEIYDADTQVMNLSKKGSSSIKLNAQKTASSEAGLSALKVSPGSLSPAFSDSVTAYSVNVGGDTSKLSVSASTKDSNAKVSVSGGSDLKVGSNTVTCKVTAEDGTTKTFTITVNKSAETTAAQTEAETTEAIETEAAEQASVAMEGTEKVTIDGVEYTVATRFDPSVIPAGFEVGLSTYNGVEVACAKLSDVTLLYLQSDDGNGGLFRYNPADSSFEPYAVINVSEKSIIVLTPDSTVAIPEGFKETTIQLNGEINVKGWVWAESVSPDSCLVYGMNMDGNKNFYRYDVAEKTFQRFFPGEVIRSSYNDDDVENLLNDYNNLADKYNKRFFIMVGLAVLSLVFFFMMINSKLKGGRKDRYDDDDRRKKSKKSMSASEIDHLNTAKKAKAKQEETNVTGYKIVEEELSEAEYTAPEQTAEPEPVEETPVVKEPVPEKKPEKPFQDVLVGSPEEIEEKKASLGVSKKQPKDDYEAEMERIILERENAKIRRQRDREQWERRQKELRAQKEAEKQINKIKELEEDLDVFEL